MYNTSLLEECCVYMTEVILMKDILLEVSHQNTLNLWTVVSSINNKMKGLANLIRVCAYAVYSVYGTYISIGMHSHIP